MELVETINEEKLNLLVEQIIGSNWHTSPLTEIYAQTDDNSCYQEWDLHLDEITDGVLINHFHKRFTLYYLLHGTLELQLIIILNVIKEGLELKKSFDHFSFREYA